HRGEPHREGNAGQVNLPFRPLMVLQVHAAEMARGFRRRVHRQRLGGKLFLTAAGRQRADEQQSRKQAKQSHGCLLWKTKTVRPSGTAIQPSRAATSSTGEIAPVWPMPVSPARVATRESPARL